jgi:hypothetical protein
MKNSNYQIHNHSKSLYNNINHEKQPNTIKNFFEKKDLKLSDTISTFSSIKTNNNNLTNYLNKSKNKSNNHNLYNSSISKKLYTTSNNILLTTNSQNINKDNSKVHKKINSSIYSVISLNNEKDNISNINNNNNNIDNNSNFNSYNNIYDLNLNKNYQTRHRHNKTLDKILDYYVSEFSVKGNNSSTQNDTIEKSSFLNKNISKELGQSSFNLNSFNNNSNNNNSNYSNYVPFKKINSFNNLIPKKYNINNKKIKKQVEDLYDLINYNTSQERQRKYFDRKVNSIFSPNNIHQNNMRIKKINLYNSNKKNNYNFFDNI